MSDERRVDDVRLDELAKRLDERHATQQEEIRAGDAELRRYFDQRLADVLIAQAQRDAMLDERYETQTRAIDRALHSTEKATFLRQEQSDKEFHEHIEQVRHENYLALANADKAVQAAFEASDKAISKAEVANEKRFEGVNEFRAQLNDQTNTFIPREVADATFKELRSKIESLQGRLDKSEGRGAGYASLYGWAVAGVTVLIATIAFFNTATGKG